MWTIKIDKSWGGRNIEDSWSNVYHVTSPLSAEAEEWAVIVEGFAKMERELHLNEVNFLHATVSTIAEDAPAYPANLRVFELQGVGNKAIPVGDNAVDLNICLSLKKEVAMGRSGRLLYRGALLASQVVIGTSGKSAWIGPEPTAGTLANATSDVRAFPDSLATWMLPTKANADAPPGSTVLTRVVKSVSVGGVVIARRNHRWFDRAPAGVGGG